MEIDKATGEQHCGQPMEAHFGALLAVLFMAGLNFDCRDGYRALVEIAEVVRGVGGFQPYVANTEPGSLGQETIAEIRSKLAERAEAAKSQAVLVPGSNARN